MCIDFDNANDLWVCHLVDPIFESMRPFRGVLLQCGCIESVTRNSDMTSLRARVCSIRIDLGLRLRNDHVVAVIPTEHKDTYQSLIIGGLGKGIHRAEPCETGQR